MSDFEFDRNNPLQRATGESRLSNRALWDYWLMGPKRSLRALLAQYTRQATNEDPTENVPRPPTLKWWTLEGWSRNNAWQARIIRQEEIKRAEEEAEWDARRRQIRERDWEQGGALRELAARVLAEGPNFLKTRRKLVRGSGGEPDREIVTVALNANLAVRAAEKGSQLQRLGAEMETERQKVVLALEREVNAILDAMSEVLDYDDYQRVLAALGGTAAGEAEDKEDGEA